MSILSDPDLRRQLRWPLVTLACLGMLAAFVLMRAFLMPVCLAFLLALTFSPIRRVLQRRGISPVITSAGIVLSLIAGLGLIVLTLYTPVQQYAANSVQIMAEVEIKLRGLSSAIERVAEASEKVEALANQNNGEVVETVRVDQPGLLSRMAMSTPLMVGQAVFTIVLLFFITASGDMFYAKIVESSPTFRDKRNAIGITRDIERRISRYFLTITAINAGLGVAVGVTLWALGMPNPLLFGVMAYLFNFIPFIGALAGVAVTFAIGLVSFDTVGQAAIAAGAYFALTSIEGQLITPYAVGRRLSLNPVIVFLAVAFWGWAWSFIGMFIAVPLLIVTMVIAENIEGLKGLAIFLSGERVEPDADEDAPTDKAKAAPAS